MNYIFYIILTLAIFLNSCSSVRESAGVTRKSLDEYVVVENPPLVIPPDFDLIPPDQLEEKNIDNVESDLAKEILYGLDENDSKKQDNLSTMNQILKKTDAVNASSKIREEIDEDYAQEMSSTGIFDVTFENEHDVLDAVKESECIRNKNFEGESIADCENNITTQTIKKKKKKRFILF